LLTVCLEVLGKYVTQLGFIGVLISDGPVLETSTSDYQRLVARDDDEAMEIGDESLTEDDWHFIVQATREIVEDLGTRQSPAETPAAVAAAAVVDGQGPISPPTIRMVACPARDEADEVALLDDAAVARSEAVRAGSGVCGDADRRSGLPGGAATRVPHLYCGASTRGISSDPLPVQAAADPVPRVQDRGGTLGVHREH
jgi:hypothetical protein